MKNTTKTTYTVTWQFKSWEHCPLGWGWETDKVTHTNKKFAVALIGRLQKSAVLHPDDNAFIRNLTFTKNVSIDLLK